MSLPELEKLRNIGIVAHVDAGKTTLAEQMLYLAGRIRKVGRVDDGTSQLDWLSTEKKRGITILAATTLLSWKTHHINLIDTPGHVDFSSETRRALRVLDGVIVVLSGVEGVQAHTLTLWTAIRSLGIPAIFFINKMDRDMADDKAIIKDIHARLTQDAVPLQLPVRVNDRFVGIASALLPGMDEVPKGSAEIRTQLIEQLAEHDDEVLAHFIHETPFENTWLRERFQRYARRGKIFPILMGSALHQLGIEPLLDAVVEYFPPPQVAENSELSAVVFKLQREPKMGRMAFIRVYGGELTSRQSVQNTTRGFSEKISQIRKIHADSYEDIGQVRAGDIAALCGLERTRIGDILGSPALVPEMPEMPVPVFQVKVLPVESLESSHGWLEQEDLPDRRTNSADYVALAEALQELEDEDPSLEVNWNPEIQELRIRVMGMVQVEVLQSILQDRFGLLAAFAQPTVVFKETPAKPGYGYVAYTSVPHWAVLRFHIEPASRGRGLEYRSIVRPGRLKLRYQREVQRRVPMALQQGLRGWEVTDLKVTLVEGSHHEQHTHPLDFIAATGWAIEDGLKNCGTHLLEPILSFQIHGSADVGGRVCQELLNRRAVFDTPVFSPSSFAIEGEVPASTILDLALLLQQWSGGKASMTTQLVRYDLAPEHYNDDPVNTQPKRAQVSFRSYM